MNIKTLLASVILLALTVLHSPGQVTQVPAQPQPSAARASLIMVNMLGAVNIPARIALPVGGTLLDAIASAGGLSKVANPSKIILIHKSTGEKPDSIKVDLKPIMAGAVRDIILRDGDTVVVGQAMF